MNMYEREDLLRYLKSLDKQSSAKAKHPQATKDSRVRQHRYYGGPHDLSEALAKSDSLAPLEPDAPAQRGYNYTQWQDDLQPQCPRCRANQIWCVSVVTACLVGMLIVAVLAELRH